jgi:hypothetical protein
MQPRFIGSVRHNDWGICVSVTHRCEGISSHNSRLLRGVSWRFWNTVVKYGSKCGSLIRLSGNASVGLPVTALSETTGSHPLYRSHKIRPCTTVDHLRKRKGNIKVQQFHYRPWGFQEVEAPRFQANRHMKVVRLSGLRPGRLYHPGSIPGTHFCSRLSRPQNHSVAGRIMAVRSYRVWSVSPSVVRCNSNLCTCSGYGERNRRKKERKKEMH